MTAGWVKSLQCKAKAADDVVQSHHLLHILPPSSSCRKSFNDIVDTTKHNTKPRKQPFATDHQQSRKPKPKNKPKPNPNPKPKTSVSRKPEHHATFDIRRPSDSYVPALTDLPEGHPSRNVVEIIFHTSWSSSDKVFSGCIEMVFKVQNLPRTVARFEEYRETVKSGSNNENDASREDHARCVADGNEVMRFQCLGSTSSNGGACDGAWSFQFGKGAALCTFPGSGVAHESAGGGRGRKAMLVCRVIAGRVKNFEPVYNNGRVGYDSVSGENGELLVFDSRAVLPCFLIIYNKL